MMERCSYTVALLWCEKRRFSLNSSGVFNIRLHSPCFDSNGDVNHAPWDRQSWKCHVAEFRFVPHSRRSGIQWRPTGEKTQHARCIPEDLEAIVITHHHGDHGGGALIAQKRWKVPVYANHRTSAELGLRPELTAVRGARASYRSTTAFPLARSSPPFRC